MMFPPLLIVVVVVVTNCCSVASFSSLPSSSSSRVSSRVSSCRSTKPFGARPLPITALNLLESRRTSINHISSNTALASSSSAASSSSSSSSSILLHLHDESLRPGIAAINSALPTLLPLVNQLRNTLPYFRLYSIDMLASCNYFPQELFECYTESCEVYPVDDAHVPSTIRHRDFNEYDFELDGWARWDMPTEDYYDIVAFPEDYTGYDGSDVWKFIHERIEFKKETTKTTTSTTTTEEYGHDGITHWKADFNKAISGLHAMVSAQVVRGMMDKINSSSSSSGGGGGGGGGLDPNKYMWTNPTNEYHRRLGPNGTTPRAIENMYFTAMLLLSGIRAVRDQLLLDCDAGQIGNEDACNILRSILYHPLLDDASVDVASLRLREHVLQDINNDNGGGLWEARMRSRDLLRIMNCVQCNKCRFHGKIAALGLSTAFNLVIGGDRCSGVEDVTSVHRVELAALLTSFAKFTNGIDLCLEMQQQEQQPQ